MGHLIFIRKWHTSYGNSAVTCAFQWNGSENEWGEMDVCKNERCYSCFLYIPCYLLTFSSLNGNRSKNTHLSYSRQCLSHRQNRLRQKWSVLLEFILELHLHPTLKVKIFVQRPFGDQLFGFSRQGKFLGAKLY